MKIVKVKWTVYGINKIYDVNGTYDYQCENEHDLLAEIAKAIKFLFGNVKFSMEVIND